MDQIMRFIFGFILFAHGLIHLLGVARVLKPETFAQITRSIPRSEGVLWFLAAVLLLTSLVLLLFGKNYWAAPAIVGVLVSQFVISLSWQDAKYGTLANLLILAVSLPAYGKFQFHTATAREVNQLLANIPAEVSDSPPSGISVTIPPIVVKWLVNSGAANRPGIKSVRLQQKGRMKISPDSKWMDFTASQYFNVKDPAFIWLAEVNPTPLVWFDGRDKLENGNGEMVIKVLSLVNVVNERRNEKVDSGTMLRYLGEICWFPYAATEPYMQWEELTSTTALGRFRHKDREVEGIFRFSPEGDLTSFEALRFYGGGKGARQEKWLIEVLEYKVFDGIKVPRVCRVTWKLPEGDFTWLELEITQLEFNKSAPFL